MLYNGDREELKKLHKFLDAISNPALRTFPLNYKKHSGSASSRKTIKMPPKPEVVPESLAVSSAKARSNQNQVVATQNIQETAQHYRKKFPEAFSQTITGCTPRDIFYEYNVRHFDIRDGHFSGCSVEQGPLLEALLAGKTVILTGSLTPELEAFFAPLLCGTPPYLFFNNQRHAITGQLILITDTTLSFLKASEQDRTPPHRPPAALLKSQAQTVPDLPDLKELQHAAAAVKQLHDQRLSALEEASRQSRIITLVGPTGCGKTSFMNSLKQQGKGIFWGLDALDDFIRDGDEDSLLFIDEANLSDPRLIEKSIDLLQDPPCLWHKRIRHDIKGKIVCAMNPNDYGNGREESEVLNHSAVVGFNALPLAVLYEQSIAPALRATDLSEKLQLEIGQEWLRLYRDCLASNPQAPCISPRELEAIALAFAAGYTHTKPTPDPMALAKNIAYQFAKTLLPEKALPEKPAASALLPLPEDETFENGDRFIFLKEHQEAWTLLNYILRGQAFNRERSLGLSGISHVNLMGESNLGKSAFLRAACQALRQPATYLPASALLSTQRELLAAAAKNGGILIHDEANMAYLERELNAYLMKMDLQGKPLASETPFIYLSTGNPAKHFAGRREKSIAEERRQCCVQMPRLSAESLKRLRETLSQEQRAGIRIGKLLSAFFTHPYNSASTPESTNSTILGPSESSHSEKIPSSPNTATP